MGQSQLLFIVLAVIIVGIAVTVGITQFGESAVGANRDAMSGDCMSYISKAHSWFKRPTAMGGGGNSFTGVDLDAIKVAASNANGGYALSATDGGASVTCVATSASENNQAGEDLVVTVVFNPTATPQYTNTDNYAEEAEE
jgi:hypothetical protein